MGRADGQAGREGQASHDLMKAMASRRARMPPSRAGRLPMLNRRVLTSVVVALATTITTQSFAQDRGTGAPPAAGAKAGATQGTFTTSDAIPWKPVDPKHPGLQMFAVWGNPNEGASEILQKFPAGMDSGWHWHSAAYQGVVIQGKFTHTFKGAAPRQAGRDPCGRNLRDRCMMTSAKRAATASSSCTFTRSSTSSRCT